jgi:hypothetical protein
VITTDFSDPIDYSPSEDPKDVTDRLMARIREMVKVAEKRYPQSPSGPDDTWWLPAHLGGTAPTVEEAEEQARRDTEERRARRAAER